MKSAKPSAGFSVKTVAVCFIVIIVIILGAAGWGYFHLRGENLRLLQEKAAALAQLQEDEVKRLQAQNDANRDMARTRLQEVLLGVRSTTNSLENLLVSLHQLALDAASFKTNDLGRKLAVFPDLVVQARHLFETDFGSLPTETESITRLENARRTELTLASKIGGTYAPDADVIAVNKAAQGWADDALRKVSLAQNTLAALIMEAKVKVLAGPLPATTLDEAVRRLAQTDAISRQTNSIAVIKAATDAADRQQATNTTAAITLAARTTTAEIEQKRLDEEARLAREAVAAKARVDYLRTQAELEAKAQQEAARKLVLQKRADDPDIVVKLAPFITPGYRTAMGRISPDLLPLSFKELKNSGALQPDLNGLKRLSGLAFTSTDKSRPRWRFRFNNQNSFLSHPEEMEMVKETQALLRELGPVLVEMGKLAP